MATDFTQDSVLHFLRSNGGRVKNSDLLAHFKPFIKDHENRTRNRELFKKFVNSVAVVKPEEGVSYVVLRKRIQGHVDGNIPVVSHTPETRASRQPAPQERRIEDRSPRSPANRNQDKGQVGWFGTHFARQKAPVPRGETNQLTDKILPAAGIVDNVQDYALPPVYKEPLLPLYNATIPNCRDLREDVRSRASSNRSLSSSHDGSYFHRHSQVPLEPNEHDWLVKSATGTWPDVYDLFRDDPSLLTKRDFITGYNILHWIAKHGDHRVLNTLAYGVDKAGLKLDVDAKTACGYTALHLAALHGNKQMVRLLVHKFRANVALRDTSGKKAWQYLSGPKDLLELLGAPNCSTPASSSTPQSPVNSPRAARVKRTTSIAAFLNKTLIKFPGREAVVLHSCRY
uniref:SOWAHA-C winged helix-turn-helix domain-containing protein n=1 Tax=Esox lucius TaxID=8010 RepID=A0A3P8YIF7_ESOLU